MNCREFEMNVCTWVRTDSARSDYTEHAARCIKCAGRLAGEHTLVIGFRAVRQQLVWESAPAKTESLLLEAFRQHVVSAGSGSRAPILGNFGSARATLPIAAAVIVSISVLLLLALNRTLTAPADVIPAIAFEPLHNISVEPVVLKANTSVPKRTAAKRRERAKQVTIASEVVTEFFPLTAQDADSTAITQLMRVELPASSMMDVGFPVAEEDWNKQITAELAVGEDGIARAIRFVKPADR
jgi:hypothetical protein